MKAYIHYAPISKKKVWIVKKLVSLYGTDFMPKTETYS